MRLCDKYVIMSKRRVASKGLDGICKVIIAIRSQGDDVLELRLLRGTTVSEFTSATSGPCIFKSTSNACAYMSRLRSFPATVTAALSTSTSPGDIARKSSNAVRAEVARLNASCVFAADFFMVGSSLGAFHSVFITVERPCEAPFTVRIARILLSGVGTGVTPLRVLFALEMVRVDASSWEIASVETVGAFPLTVDFFADGTGGRLVFAFVAMSR